MVSTACGAGYPHSPSYGLNCDDCHNLHGTAMFGGAYLLPDWTQITIDDTQANSLCWSCHNGTTAHHVETHSSLQMSDDYDDDHDDDDDDESSWTIDCVVCHNPHIQYQLTEYAPDSYLFTSTAVSMTTTTLTFNPDPGWEIDTFAGYIVVPNTLQKSYTYKITGNSSNVLTVDSVFPMDLDVVNVGQPSAIFYGKLVRDNINLERIIITDEYGDPLTKTGIWEARLYSPTGDNSYSDGDTTINGVCEICHTMTDHFQNDGVSGDDWPHSNADYPARTNCMVCHPHEGGFAHGGSCWECHGHDEGGNDVDYGPVPTGGKGTYGSHSTHTEMDSDDQRGPQLSCFYCHAGTVDGDPDLADFAEFYAFRTGTDSNSDGVITLKETDICNNCHSPNGTYDGVNDPDLGAKYGDDGELGHNWENRVYSGRDNKSLKPGLEKWCATCHDEDPSIVDGVTAPNVIGDEDNDTYTYSAIAPGYGYYKTGHGLPNTETYPASGGITAGPAIECNACHDFLAAHVDGEARTFSDNDTSATNPSEYRDGYRLKLVYGLEPMQIPRQDNLEDRPNTEYNFPLCADCHGKDPFIDPANLDTNFITYDDDYNTVNPDNRHEEHMVHGNLRWAADWEGGFDTSAINCVICHNVHGSTRMTMIRDGKLIGTDPGLEMWYYNENTSTSIDPTLPADMTLSASTGTTWFPNSVSNVMCIGCHGGPIIREYRLPFTNSPVAPTLAWTGESGYLFDGASPDSGPSGGDFVFKVKYTDLNNDSPTAGPPAAIEVWIDLDDSNSYEPGEMFAMTELDIGDTNYMDGKVYTFTRAIDMLGAPSDDILNYLFYAHDGTGGATGPPTEDSSIKILSPLPAPDPPPVLTWLDDGSCQVNGAGPATGFDSFTTFTFSVVYTDDACPSAGDIVVWIDENNDGYDDPGDKHDLIGDGTDTNCTDGRKYTYSTTLPTPGEIKYYFYGYDGTSVATGDPTDEQTITVLDPADWGSGALYLVCSDGTHPSYGVCDFSTILSAINGTGPNVTLMVEQGTYHEQIDFEGSDDNVILKSECGKDLTIIDADDTGRVVEVKWSSFGSVIDGFGITDGTRGVYLDGSGITVKNSAIYANTLAGSGAGVFSQNNNSRFTLSNSEVYDNHATAGHGGGLYFASGSHTIINSSIHDNDATGNGGGVYLIVSDSRLTMNDSEVSLNHSNGNGGGFYFHQGIYTISDSIIRDNTAGGFSGAIHFDGSAVGTSVSNTTIKDNTAVSSGGAMYSNQAKVNFDKAIITGNESTGSSGGALYTNSTTAITFTNSIISANTANTNGGAVNLGGGTVSYINTTVADNHALKLGGAIWTCPNGNTIRNSVFWGNIADNSDAAAAGPGHNIFKGCTPFTSVGTISDSDIDTTDSTYFVQAIWGDGTNIISPAVDPQFVGGGDYHLKATSPVIDQANATYAPDDDIDGDSRPQGAADDMGADEAGGGGANGAPTLTWSIVAGYDGTDGVDPDSAVSGSGFDFRVTYTDTDDDAPVVIQLWIDEDDNGVFNETEKYDMTQVVADGLFTNGEDYTKPLNVFDTDGTINYFFHASDGIDEATGAPTSVQTLVFTNNEPTLDWSPLAGYDGTDGVDPNSAVAGSNFTFRVDYTDEDDDVPAPIQVWIDLNDSETYEPGEKFAMGVAAGGDADYTNGEPYILTTVLAYVGDGILNYRFYASDGQVEASDDPTEDNTLTVTPPVGNTAPLLAWATGQACLTTGVRPPVGTMGADFEFMVNYTDGNNECPTGLNDIQVWVDGDLSGDYEEDEKHDLVEDDPLDVNCVDGKLYKLTLPLGADVAGTFDYRFYATDGLEAATSGDPVIGDTVTLMSGLKVRPTGGLFWFDTIQDAVDHSTGNTTIMVWPNDDFTAATYNEAVNVESKPNTTLRSACGPDLTIINSGGAALRTVMFLAAGGGVLDGFSVTGATSAGVHFLNSDSHTVQNSLIYGNSNGVVIGNSFGNLIDNNIIYNNTNRGINVEGGVTISNTEIHTNGTGGFVFGAGILFNSGSHTISNCNIHDNIARWDGGANGYAGGFMLLNATLSVTNSVFKDNEAERYGGAMVLNAGNGSFTNVIMAENQAPSGGMGYMSSGSASFINSTFANNEATAGDGGVFKACNLVNTTIRNSLFDGNTASGAGDNAYKDCGDDENFLTISDTRMSTGAGFIDDGNGQGVFTDQGNIWPENIFFDPNLDAAYHLPFDSWAIDKANAAYAPADDIDGQVRPNPDTSIPDLGADEYYP